MKTQKCRSDQTLNGSGSHLLSLIFSCAALLGLGFSAQAQFTGPTPYPACSGTTSNFAATISARNYIWTFENIIADLSITSLPSTSAVYLGSPLSIPGYVTLDQDNGQWFSFVANSSSNELFRLDYGTSPLNVPVPTSLGLFGTNGQLLGIDILQDASGIWYGFAANGTQLIRWQYTGNSLSGSPINKTTMTFPANLAWPHQLSIKKFEYPNEYIGFVANRNGSVTRLDFGSSLNDTPTLTNLPQTNNLTACNFALHEEDATWHMLTTNLLDNSISRLIFYNGIQDNAPVVSNLGNLGNELDLPRGIFFLANCLGDPLYAYVINEGGEFFKLDFPFNSVWQIPNVTKVGTLSGIHNHALVFPYLGSLYALESDYSAHSIRRLKLLDFPNPNRMDYYSSSFNYTFTHLPSTQKYVRFYADLGGPMGSTSACIDLNTFNCLGKNDNRIQNTLYQNSPNPFKSNTSIKYHIVNMQDKGYISIHNSLGREIKRYKIKKTGEGEINLSWSMLPGGIYYYTLIVDNNKIDTKKMVLTVSQNIN